MARWSFETGRFERSHGTPAKHLDKSKDFLNDGAIVFKTGVTFMKLTWIAAIGAFVASSLSVQAQTMTPAEISAIIDQKVSSQNEYQALLNDPDPARSLAAMEIMMGSGDTELERLALEYGLYSPNPVVQRTAIDAFFATQPILNVYYDAGKSNSDWRFYKTLTEAGGSILQDGTGFSTADVGVYDETKKCYMRQSGEKCRARVSDTGVSFLFWNNWFNTTLNDQGELVGAGAFPDIISVAAVIPITQ
jgi:hypothetical protein